jgi:hypothetical protein
VIDKREPVAAMLEPISTSGTGGTKAATPQRVFLRTNFADRGQRGATMS